MKGIIFQALEELVEEHFGLELWDEMITTTNPVSGGIYVASGTYDDQELMDYVELLTKKMGKPSTEVIQFFGVFLFKKLVESYPQPLDNVSLREFLLKIDSVVHIEVKKLYPHAHVPQFVCEEVGNNIIVMHYHSKKKLFALAHGLILGAAQYFQTTVAVKMLVQEGGEQCTFAIKFLDD